MGDWDENAINFYKEYYGENLTSNANEYLYSHSGKSIEVRGDVCFNLNLKKGKFYTLYGSIINKEKVFEDLNNLLQEIRYSPMNISIMPKTGGLNNIKKAIGNDRFDTFACLLSRYYDGDKVPIINAGAINMLIDQRKLLAEFLDNYSNVNAYFEDFYGIGEKLTKNLVEAGSNVIITKEQFYEYVKLALGFWRERIKQEKMKNYLADKDYETIMNKIEEIIKEGVRL